MAKIHSEIKFPIRSHERAFDGTDLILYGTDPSNQPTYSELVAVVTNGGSFRGIKLGFQFTTLAVGRDVPAGVPGSTITPEGEATRQKTWLEWIRDNSQSVYQRVVGTPVYYVMKAALNQDLLTSEELQAAIATSGVSVIEWADFQARIQSDNYEEYTP
jgi:hypothetical protein